MYKFIPIIDPLSCLHWGTCPHKVRKVRVQVLIPIVLEAPEGKFNIASNDYQICLINEYIQPALEL